MWWSRNRTLYIFIQENAFEMADILSRPQCVNRDAHIQRDAQNSLEGGPKGPSLTRVSHRETVSMPLSHYVLAAPCDFCPYFHGRFTGIGVIIKWHVCHNTSDITLDDMGILARYLTTAKIHYNDVTMNSISSQITSLTIVYSAVLSGTDQSKHQSSASLAFVRGIHRSPWIPRTNGQLRGKCFHLMTSSCYCKLWAHFIGSTL